MKPAVCAMMWHSRPRLCGAAEDTAGGGCATWALAFVRRTAFTILVAYAISFALPASAHPTLTHNLRIVVHPDRLTLEARIVLPEVDIANTFVDESQQAPDPSRMERSIAAHAAYVLGHLRVGVDESPLVGKVTKSSPSTQSVTWDNFEDLESAATYTIEYPLPHPPAKIRVEQDLLKEYGRMGQPWVVMLVTEYRQSHESAWNEALLTKDQPLEVSCNWPAHGEKTSATEKRLIWRTAGEHARHGLMHILTGYDHLLFVAALVIGATQLWDLVKVVSAFAIAHTLTLTLSVLHLVRVPSSIVEPMIAASIVCVALQNVFFPRHSRGPARLAIAFGFGLFHGLGFAGGLADAMSDMPTAHLATALIAFTVGVELAHQLLIIPLYFLLKRLRAKPINAGSTQLPFALRLVSLAISIAGVAYLIVALKEARA